MHALRTRRMKTVMVMVMLGLSSHVVALTSSSGSSAAPPGSASAPGSQDWLDCVRASEMCNQNAQCSSRYRVLRQCLVGKDWNTMLGNRDCQAAMEVLQEHGLVHCRCRRGMKKELQCLQSYWSINMGLTEGEDQYEESPYELMPPVHLSDASPLASIILGVHASAGKTQTQCLEADNSCNPCLDATKACNLNTNCQRQRSNYITMCTRGQGLPQEGCSRKRCHKALRQFFERVESQYSYGLLFCSCRHSACAERRRQTIVPNCSYEDKSKPNCLQLRRNCRQDALCRSRLADFHKHCPSSDSAHSCSAHNYQACLTAYTGLIGTELTPNYESSNHSDFTVSPWCNCQGSANEEEECHNFLQDFKENSCLRNAMQVFGYGTDVNPLLSPIANASISPESSTQLRTTNYPNYHSYPNNLNQGSKEEAGGRCSSAKGFMCEEIFAGTGFTPGHRLSTGNWSPAPHHWSGWIWLVSLLLLLAMGNLPV